jgi:protein phosphatase
VLNKKKVMKQDVYVVDYGVFSHIGQRRQNQDAVMVMQTRVPSGQVGRLLAVADGMGGHLGGGIASHLACDGLKQYFEKELNNKIVNDPKETARRLSEAILRIDRRIRQKGLRDSSLEDMGTTLSCLTIVDTYSIIAHVGDSRIYRLRNGALSCLTVDHTFVQDMIFEGEVDPEKAHLHPLRHMLTRAVGTGESLPFVDTRTDRFKEKDYFLLCTDGLYNTVAASSIKDLLSRHASASVTAEKLVCQTIKAGARENVTAVVVRIK